METKDLPKPKMTDKALNDLFIKCLSETMHAYVAERKKVEAKLAEKGMVFKRGAYETLTWSSEHIAAQYVLCIQKQCKLNSKERTLVMLLGNAAVQRLDAILKSKEDKKNDKDKSAERR